MDAVAASNRRDKAREPAWQAEVGDMIRNKDLDPSRPGIGMNLTPMIDCTFLLLIFFMVVSEMASLDMESIALPYADQAQPRTDELYGLTINIKKDDAKQAIVRVAGRQYDKDKLAELIRREAIKSERDHDPDYPGINIYKLNVLVRCDREAKYETVQWVMDACSRTGVYRTTLAASPSSE
jgi:biopolymer transport protein ExbD